MLAVRAVIVCASTVVAGTAPSAFATDEASPPVATSVVPTAKSPKEAAASAKRVQSAAPTPKPDILSVTRIVGEVGERFLTSREVQILDAVHQALDKNESHSARRILSGQEKTFPAEVSRALDEWVVYLEARSFSSTPPAKTAVAEAEQTVQAVWGAKPEWLNLEVGGDELRDTVERILVATAFERLKTDAALVPVSDEDALQYYKKNRLRFGSLPFSAFKDNIKDFLIKQQTEKRLSEWHEVLRRKYKVRNFIAG